MQLELLSKEEGIHLLQKMPIPELWDHLLTSQVTLNFAKEAEFLKACPGWNESSTILEIGAGNGEYLSHLAQAFPEKNFVGMDYDPKMIEIARDKFPHLLFLQGDAVVFEKSLQDKFDVIVFRLVLQHLSKPYLALENAFHYLKKDGLVIIVDSHDPARIFSHRFLVLEEGVRQLNLYKMKQQEGSRLIAQQIVKDIKANKAPLHSFYKLVKSTINENGHEEKKQYYTSLQDKYLYFNQLMLFLTLLNKRWGFQLDLSAGYDEMLPFLKDDKAFFSPGVQYLLLKKLS